MLVVGLVLLACYFPVLALRDAVLALGVLGTNCFPLAVPSRFLRVVAAYSEGVKDLTAFFGRYRSPVAFGPWVEGLPDLVPHSSFVHLDNDFCLLVLGPPYPPPDFS